MSPQPPCSTQWNVPGLPIWGTAPAASFWVGLEQNGPWGGRAWVESGLDAQVGSAIEQACLGHDGRGVLVRDPVSHAVTQEGTRRVLVCGGLGTRPWLLAGEIDDPRAVLELPFALLASGSPEDVAASVGWLQPHREGVLLVCGNGRRDACCARLGGPLARVLAAARPGRFWESSHLGGHRYAPTVLVLPTAQLLGRVTGPLAVDALAAADRGETISPGSDHDRGRSHLDPARQVAEAFVRRRAGVTDPQAVEIGPLRGDGRIAVRWRASGEVRMVVVEPEVTPPRADSCGAEPIAGRVWRASWDQGL